MEKRNKLINVMQPSLGKEELSEIKKVFKSNWIGKGKLVKSFEEQWASHINADCKNIISTNCCTEGLFIWPELFNLQKDDEVIVPTISFIGAATSVCAHGLKLVLCDVDKRTLNVRACDIEKVITKKTKAIVILHYGGIPCEMDEIMELAKKHKLIVIEDCAPGVWSEYKGKHIGTFGDMGMWSFDSMKILVCGDGGMLYFSDPAIREKASKKMYFGLETKSGYENSVAQKWWEFDISTYGHRAIMNDLTASIALAQFKKLDIFYNRRKYIHDYYNKELSKFSSWIVLPPDIPSYCKTSYYFYHIQVKNDLRDQLARYLREKSIYTTFRYYPLHKVPKFNMNSTSTFPNADYAASCTLCLPLHQSLSNKDIKRIVQSIEEFAKANNL